MRFNRHIIEKAVRDLGYVWFQDPNGKGYDVNMVGIRNSRPGNRVTNVFDDHLTLTYKDATGQWVFHEWEVTTDPGRKSMLDFPNRKGVAILAPGQYRSSHAIGHHRGQYEAVVQVKPVDVFRDNNKDMRFDMDPRTMDNGLFGINIHRSNATSESYLVDGWSAGCTVFKRVKDFNHFMRVMKTARSVWGNSFTYTLLTGDDL